jgi:hypothetical protein
MKKSNFILLYTNDIFLGYIGVKENELFVTDNIELAYTKSNTFYLHDIIKSDINFVLASHDKSIKDIKGYKTFYSCVKRYGVETLDVKLLNYKELRKLKLQKIFEDEF